MRWPHRTIRALSGGLMLLPLGCSRDGDEPHSLAGKPNVLLIVVDTLRADKLGCYGNASGLTPNIDRFALEGARFDQAYSHAPWTLPSMASLLTSTLPSVHGAGGMRAAFKKLNASARTLAECFADAGYVTGAIVNVLFLGPQFGMSQGYEARNYDFVQPQNNLNERRAGPTTDAAIQWIEKQKGRPFFLMVHYFDPHLTYDPPAEFRRKFAMIQDHAPDPKLFGTARDMYHLHRTGTKLDPALVGRLERLYDGEIAYVDEQIGRLLDHLGRRGSKDDTVVVVTADHGEEFLDHGGFEHGHTLYDELLRVPLIIRFPPTVPPRTVLSTVRHIDLAPTLCELAGVEAEPAFAGKSLIPLLTASRAGEDRDVLSEGSFWSLSWASWRRRGVKVIQSPDGVELYRVATDPREKHDLSGEATALRDALLNEMTLARSAMAQKPGVAPSLSREERAHLESIGYVGEAADEMPSSAPHGP